MKPETLSILCSPVSYEPLRLTSKPGSARSLQEILVSIYSDEMFPIREGIPVLLSKSELSGLNRLYQGFYDKIARFYDPVVKSMLFLRGWEEARFRQKSLKELEVNEGDRVLEVSIGSGANLQYLPTQARFYGLDISWGMLQQCQRNLKRSQREAELFLGNAEELPFQDGVFDVVFHTGGINRFNDRAKAISEMIRVARPGTKIVIHDDTVHLIESLTWLPGFKKMLRDYLPDYRERFIAPIALVPPSMEEVQVKEFANRMYYCLSFRKP